MPQAEIDLEKIRENVRRVRALCGVRVLVMVKADAYGHGMTEVARALHGEADIFGVATLEEGIELRRRGVREPVLVAVCRGADLPVCAAYGLTAAIADGEALEALASLRLKVFADGLQDYRLLKALETRKGRAFVTELLDRFGYLDFFTYPHDGGSLLRLHDEACRLLCDTKE